MKYRPIEAGLLSTFRYFAVVAVVYSFLNLVYVGAELNFTYRPRLVSTQILLLSFLFLVVFLTVPWFARKLKQFFLPLGITIATVAPILSIVVMRLLVPDNSTLSQVINLWSIFPLLSIPLVLIAWQYSLHAVFLFIGATALADLVLMITTLPYLNQNVVPALATTVMRAFTFGVVGHIVSRIVATKREQHLNLLHANLQLSQHATTLQNLAVSRERNRLARELHDTLAHTLSATAVNLEAIKLTVPAEMKETHYMLDQTLKATRSGLGETRRALKDLRSQPLEDMGLVNSIRELANEAALRGGLKLELNLPADPPDLTPDMEQYIYRIALEGLNNIVAHAEADALQLSLENLNPGVRLTIVDNGKGFEMGGVDRDEQFGLQGMQERARLAGGTMHLDSQPGVGTRIVFEAGQNSGGLT